TIHEAKESARTALPHIQAAGPPGPTKAVGGHKPSAIGRKKRVVKSLGMLPAERTESGHGASGQRITVAVAQPGRRTSGKGFATWQQQEQRPESSRGETHYQGLHARIVRGLLAGTLLQGQLAPPVVWLASPRASFVTGQNIIVAGGFSSVR